MLVIRLMRTGKKNQPFFRFVVTEKKNPSTAGRTTEILGFYNPLTKERKIDSERAKYWLSVGAKPSATVFNFFISDKIIEGKKIPKNKKSRKEPADVNVLVGKPDEKLAEVKPVEAKVEVSEPVKESSSAEASADKEKAEVKTEQPVSE